MRASEATTTLQLNVSEFGLYFQAGYTLVKAMEDLDREGFDAFMLQVENAEHCHPQHYLVDFGALGQIGSHWGRALVQMKAKLREAGDNRQVRIINAGPDTIACMKQQGLDTAVPRSTSLEAAYADLGLQRTGTFDTSVVVPFVNGVILAIKTVSKTESQKQSLFLQDGAAPLLGSISSLVSLQSASFTGIFILSFPESTIANLVARLTGEQASGMNSLVQSAAGEFGNLAVTSAKKSLNELGYGIKCELPVVTQARTLPDNLRHPALKSLVVPFETDIGNYYIDIRFY